MRGHAHLIAAYHPGSSLVHRAPLWLKAALLLAVAVACFAIPNPYASSAALAAVVVAHLRAGLPPARLWKPIRLMLVFLLLIGGFSGGNPVR